MKKLNQAWRNQKSVSAQSSDKSMVNKEEYDPVTKPGHTTATNRRRLGRFALSARQAPVVRKIVPSNDGFHDRAPEDGSFLVSFMSSGSSKADCDLLAEMDKVEAAMNLSSAKTVKSDLHARENSSVSVSLCKPGQLTTDTAQSSAQKTCKHMCTLTHGNKRKAVKQSCPQISKEDSSPSSPTKWMNLRKVQVGGITKVNSPSSSPIDKRPKYNSRTPALVQSRTRRTNPIIQTSQSSFPTPEGRFYGRKRKEPNKQLDGDLENDISFSPLLETPNISESSDEENGNSAKCNVKGRQKKCHLRNSVNKGKKSHMTKVPLNVIETPKRSSARKRQSPKNLMSPDVKVSKSTRNELSPRDELPSRENKITGMVQDSELNGSEVAPVVVQTKNSVNHFLESNNNSQRHKTSNCTSLELEQELRSSSNALTTSGTASPGFILSSSSVNTPVNVSLTEDKRLLKSWGLPEPVLAAYQKQGVTTMFEWQAECLLSPSVLDGGNLIYSAPTSAGKTLVAEILVLKRVLETRKKALIILPFVSVAREKMFSLQRLYQDAGIRVGGYMGSHSPAGGFSALDVAICTIEKGNGLINRMMEDGRINDIGVVVVDELHMVGDSHRGYLLELMLTKLEFLSLKRESDQRLQIIGMSATLPNLEVLAKWLGAALYRTNFRPVPLSEHIKVDNRIYDSQLVPQGEVPARYISPDDTDHILALCLETVMEKHSVLLFCPTKNWCEKLCETIARKFYQITHSQAAAAIAVDSTCKENNDNDNKLILNKTGLRDSLEQLRRCPVGVDPMLGRCVINGVAYHHAGLTFDERDIIEGAFREGNLRVLVATSTLSSGVNLPARRVIIRTPMFHGKVIDVLTFKQMSGRAGRKGVDTEGESILICKPSEKMKGRVLLQSELPPVESCLYFDEESGLSRSLKRAILEVVVSGVTSSPEDVMTYIKCTLLSASMRDSTDTEPGPCTDSLIEKCITFLQDNEFVSMQTVKKEDGTECKRFFPTQLGSAILASSLSPDEGLLVFAELQKARKSFVLESELHVIYLVTPVYTTDVATSIDWYHFYTLWENLSPAERRVADLVGVKESFIAQAIGGRINKKTEAQRKTMAVHHRFYTSLVLNTLVREIPLMEVAAKFNLNKGQLQSLQQSAATYTGMLTVFCQRLGWHNLELILSRFQRRLSMGVQHELVDLVRISALTASSARMLYNAGYQTVADVARAEAIEVEELFKTAVPFQSDKKQEGETDWERKERQKVKCIWLTGRKGMTELDAAKEIIQEAKGIVQGDLGVKDIAWNLKDNETVSESSDESGDNDDDEEVEEECVDNGKPTDGMGNLKENESDKENVQGNDTSLSKLENRGRRDQTSNYQHKEASDTSSFTKIKSKTWAKRLSSSTEKRKSLNCNTASSIKSVFKESSVCQNKNYSLTDEVCLNGTVTNKFIDGDQGDISLDSQMKPETSINYGKTRRKNHNDKRRKSIREANRSKVSEKSFFGQVVVTPPLGLRPLVDDRNKRKVDGEDSPAMIRDEMHTSDNNGNQESVCESSQTAKQSPPRSMCKLIDRKLDSSSRDVHGKVESTSLNKPSCSNQDLKGVKCLSYTVENTGIIQHEKACENVDCAKALPLSSNILCDNQSSVVRDSNVIPSISRTSEIDTNVLADPLDANEQNCEVICDSKNSSHISESLSFSESFILDSQTAALINGGCDEYKSSSQSPLVRDKIIDKTSNTRNVLNFSPKQSSIKSNTDFDKEKSKSIDRTIALCVSSAKLLTENDDKTNNIGSHSPQGSLSIFDSSSTGVSICNVEPEGKQKNTTHHTSGKLVRSETSSLSSSFSKSPTSQDMYPARDYKDRNDSNEDQDISDDEPESSLVTSCYERVSNFDEGMLECSGDDDFGVNDSLSELNILRNSNEANNLTTQTLSTGGVGVSKVQNSKSKSSLISQKDARDHLLLSTSWLNPYKAFSKSIPISDSQYTDDSLLAAVDLGGLTPLSSHHGKDTDIPVSQEHNSALQSKMKSNNHMNKSLECPSKNPNTYASDTTENNMFLSDSLSASLVDQAFAQCDITSIKTSSPYNNINNNNLIDQTKSMHKLPPQRSTHTTPVSKNTRGKTTGAHVEISPVLWENPDSNSNSLNNSSCHDGSDCVPPTPPDETSSHASPFKLAFLSPMASRKKACASNSSKKMIETDLRVSVNEKLSRRNLVKENGIDLRGDKNDMEVSDSEIDKIQSDYLDDSLVCADDPHEDVLPSIDGSGRQITSQSQLFTQQSFTIIDVCAHRDLFQTFLNEWKSKTSFSLALACEKMPSVGKGKSPKGIGSRFNKRKSTRLSHEATDTPVGLAIPNAGVQLVGVAVAWEHRDAYYISLMSDSHKEQERDADDSLAEPPLCESISFQDRIDAVVKHLHTHSGCNPRTVQIYDTKTTYITLAKTLGVCLEKCEDPRVADWLKEPGSRLKNLHRMVTTYLPEELSLLEEVGGGSSYQSLGFDVKSRASGRIRACTESILAFKLMGEYQQMLQEQGLWQAFEETEMPAMLTLSRMELNGFGISMLELESQKSLMNAKLESIEQTAYNMAGHVFSLTSLDDIAKILYLELKLPLNGDPNAVPHIPLRGTRNKKTVGGTSKEILEKLTKFHPLPALILEWRRISSALTKSLFALQRTAQHCERLDMVRVFGDCQIFSSTGRVSMAEPNIQNIPKDFCVELKDVQGESSTSISDQQILSQSVSMRKMFVPFAGGVILSADYSQLELRIIAHLSGDSKLGRILNTEGGDVFKLIAAQFKSLEVEEVTATDRQQAKQVCYGMLYGIGPKALGEQIGVCENEAIVFMENFKSTYPGVRTYLRETIEFCQKNGYVKTLFNRRRYLPSIKHTNPHARAQAERQAVNTSVQGSAADLVKKAMTNIDLKLMEMFPDCRVSHSQAPMTKKTGTKPPQGAFFLLQLHDELIYEVNVRNLDIVARLVKQEMEGACKLCVRMPVKVNAGPSWGQLEEYDFRKK